MRLGCVELFIFLVLLSRCLVEKGVALCDLPQLASLEELERAFSMLHSEHTRARAHHKHRIDTLEARVRGLNTRPVNQESSQVWFIVFVLYVQNILHQLKQKLLLAHHYCIRLTCRRWQVWYQSHKRLYLNDCFAGYLLI